MGRALLGGWLQNGLSANQFCVQEPDPDAALTALGVDIVSEAADLLGRQDADRRVARGSEQVGQRSVELSRGEPTHGTSGRAVDLTLRWGLVDR